MHELEPRLVPLTLRAGRERIDGDPMCTRIGTLRVARLRERLGRQGEVEVPPLSRTQSEAYLDLGTCRIRGRIELHAKRDLRGQVGDFELSVGVRDGAPTLIRA